MCGVPAALSTSPACDLRHAVLRGKAFALLPLHARCPAVHHRRANREPSFSPCAAVDLFCRYEHALSKANYASLALRPEAQADEDEGAGLDEDEDLYQSLNK